MSNVLYLLDTIVYIRYDIVNWFLSEGIKSAYEV